jgi:predicted transcriptional regulator
MASQQTRALWHPLRVWILELVISRPVTLSQIATEVGHPLDKIAYHSSILCGAGCIQPAQATDPDPVDPLFEATT